jgi:hypothetical protein
MAPGHATLHVLRDSVYSVVWLPASALKGVPLDAAGQVAQSDIEHDQAAIIARLQTQWVLRDGAEQARTLRLDLILQPSDDAPTSRADQLVMLHHAVFSHPPRQVELETDLFGDPRTEPQLTVSATSDSGAETITLRPNRARYVFFLTAKSRSLGRSLARSVAWSGALAAVALGLAVMVWRKSRRR